VCVRFLPLFFVLGLRCALSGVYFFRSKYSGLASRELCDNVVVNGEMDKLYGNLCGKSQLDFIPI